MLATWRKQRARAEDAALQARKRGRKPDPVRADARNFEQLQHENERLRRRLAEAHTVIEVQKDSATCRDCERRRARADELMAAVEQLSPLVGVVRACGVLGMSRARVYRLRRRCCQSAGSPGKPQPRRRLPLALATAEARRCYRC